MRDDNHLTEYNDELGEYIKRFADIADDKWCVSDTNGHNGKYDAYGHCGEYDDYVSDDAHRLWIVTRKIGSVMDANDGIGGYPGSTPKERVINFLIKCKKEYDPNRAY